MFSPVSPGLGAFHESMWALLQDGDTSPPPSPVFVSPPVRLGPNGTTHLHARASFEHVVWRIMDGRPYVDITHDDRPDFQSFQPTHYVYSWERSRLFAVLSVLTTRQVYAPLARSLVLTAIGITGGTVRLLGNRSMGPLTAHLSILGGWSQASVARKVATPLLGVWATIFECARAGKRDQAADLFWPLVDPTCLRGKVVDLKIQECHRFYCWPERCWVDELPPAKGVVLYAAVRRFETADVLDRWAEPILRGVLARTDFAAHAEELLQGSRPGSAIQDVSLFPCNLGENF